MPIAWLLLSLAALPAGVESVKAYKGKDGQVVEVVRLSPRDSGKAAVRVRGSDSVADGLVLDCSVTSERDGFTFTTKHDGAAWNVLVARGEAYQVYVPERPEFRVVYDEAAANAVDAVALLAEQKAQRGDGRLWAFERKPYPHLWNKYDAKAADASAALTKACGRKVALTIEWHTFPDDVMADLDAWKQCEPVVGYLQKQCGKAAAFDAVTCALGDKLSLSRNGAALRFVTTRTGAKDAAGALSGSKVP